MALPCCAKSSNATAVDPNVQQQQQQQQQQQAVTQQPQQQQQPGYQQQQPGFQQQPMMMNQTNNVTNVQIVHGLPAAGPSWLTYVELTTNQSVYGLDVTGQHNSPKIVVENKEWFLRNSKLTDTHTTDAVRTRNKITEGKHVWEIEWHPQLRGLYATVGVSNDKNPLQFKGKTSLVGNTSSSWGFDIARMRLVHNKKCGNRWPPLHVLADDIPQVFYMFLDMDRANGGVLSFGTYHEYWGTAYDGLLKVLNGQDLYVMLSTNVPQAHVRLTYKGQFKHPADIEEESVTLKAGTLVQMDTTVQTQNVMGMGMVQQPAYPQYGAPPPGYGPPGQPQPYAGQPPPGGHPYEGQPQPYAGQPPPDQGQGAPPPQAEQTTGEAAPETDNSTLVNVTPAETGTAENTTSAETNNTTT